jgi:hypothetical protein
MCEAGFDTIGCSLRAPFYVAETSGRAGVTPNGLCRRSGSFVEASERDGFDEVRNLRKQFSTS